MVTGRKINSGSSANDRRSVVGPWQSAMGRNTCRSEPKLRERQLPHSANEYFVPTSDIQSVGSSVTGYRVQESLSQLGQRVRFGQSVRWSVKVATQHSKVQVTLRRHAEDWAVRAVSLIHRENGCENSLRRAEGFLAQPLAYLPRRNRGRVHLHKHCTHPNFPLLEQSLPSLRPAWDSTHAARQTTLECVDGGSHEGQT